MKRIKEIVLNLEGNSEKWLYQNRFKIIRFLVTATFLKLFSSVPYLNLIVSPEYVYYLIVIAIALIFEIRVFVLVYVVFVLFILAFVFYLAGSIDAAESLGNFIYVILFYTVLRLTFMYA